MLEEARRAVVRACRDLVDQRLVVGTAGNVSVRVGDLVVISPSGVDYATMTADDVGVHDLSGAVVEAALKPSSELPLHLAVYAASGQGGHDGRRAVVHTHGAASTALSTLVDVVPASHYYSAMFGGRVRVAPYATFGTPALADGVVRALDGRSGALMANHGAVVVGDDLAAAVEKVAYLEYVSDVQLRAMSTGVPVAVLDDAEVARVAERLSGYGQER